MNIGLIMQMELHACMFYLSPDMLHKHMSLGIKTDKFLYTFTTTMTTLGNSDWVE